jgi:hypothetical protein
MPGGRYVFSVTAAAARDIVGIRSRTKQADVFPSGSNERVDLLGLGVITVRDCERHYLVLPPVFILTGLLSRNKG